jgi:hypothetical protein
MKFLFFLKLEDFSPFKSDGNLTFTKQKNDLSYLNFKRIFKNKS